MNGISTTLESAIGFYVGDICYVLNDSTYDHVWGDRYGYADGEIHITKDETFAVFTTGIGDGCYRDTQQKYEFGVDAGVIGMIPAEILLKYGKSELRKEDGTLDLDTLNYYGHFFPVDEPTEASFDAELLHEGWDRSTYYNISVGRETIEIYTDPREDPDYEDEDEYDEDEEEDDEDEDEEDEE